MLVKLVWATPSGDDLVAYMARVSNPANQGNQETAPRLIQYLIKHQHWSPLEMVSACLEIETTRDIGRQILRHRSFSFQEFSQRYASVDALPAAPLRQARMQDPKNRQASLDTADEDLRLWWNDAQDQIRRRANAYYERALERGIAKEVARAVLPEGLTNSRMYMAGTLRSWLHFCALRTGNGTQPETAAIAGQCVEILRGQFPAIFAGHEEVHGPFGA